MPNGKDDDGESCSDDDSEDEENQTVSTFMNSIQGSIDLCFIWLVCGIYNRYIYLYVCFRICKMQNMLTN